MSQVKVGLDWTRCPVCKAPYLLNEAHHPACPIGQSDALCHYCGGVTGRTHAAGCPHITNLYPISHKEADARLECSACEVVFELGDCFVAGKVAILCLGCGWLEAAGVLG